MDRHFQYRGVSYQVKVFSASEGFPCQKALQFSDKESDVIWNSIGDISRSAMIGPENWRHFLRQSDAKLKTITTWSPVNCTLKNFQVREIMLLFVNNVYEKTSQRVKTDVNFDSARNL